MDGRWATVKYGHVWTGVLPVDANGLAGVEGLSVVSGGGDNRQPLPPGSLNLPYCPLERGPGGEAGA